MSTETMTPVAFSRGLLTRLLTSIADSGPWGPLLAELTFLALVLLVTALLWWMAGGPVMKALARRVQAPVESLRPLRTGARWFVVFGAAGSLVGHFTALDLFTIVAGAIALIATGFVALWSTLSNILCTILILVTRPFRIGDEVSFPPDPLEGRVIDLSFFFTTLEAKDGRFINVPNTTFFQRIVVRRETKAVTPDLGEQLAQPRAAVLEPAVAPGEAPRG
ncbi:MAG: mechanosensitive ion channel [Myxococcaceae bacterium]|nr:mechanosensitive ion channel [Myxococcaceae bacterium]